MSFELATVSTNNITISTVQAIDGNIEPDSNNLFANTSSIVIGNVTHTTVISAEGVSAPFLSIGNTLDNVTINSTSFQIDSNGANTYIDAFTAQFSGLVSVGTDLELNGALVANGSLGNTGEVLHSNGTALYWAADEQGVTSVTAGDGLSGNITSTGTISVVANTGLVSNATGVFVNSDYIATLTANNANNLNGKAESALNVNNALTANTATYLGSSINTGNSTGIYSTGVVTASGVVSGSELVSTNASGDEGGEIKLTKPPNGTLSGGVTIDAYQNKIRFFEQGGNARGAYIDLSACANGAGTNLLSGSGSGTVTSVDSGNGLTGGPITGSGTLSVQANNGIVANSTGTFVNGNTGLVVNATGVHINSTYIGTLTANNADNLGGTAAASYVQNTDSRTLSGNLNFTGANVNYTSNLTIASTGELIIAAGAGIYANGGLGSDGQVLTSNGTSIYWSTSAAGFTNGSSISVNNFVLTGAFSANSSNGGSGNFLRSSGTGAYWANVSILDVYYANNTLAYSATGNSLTTGITTGKSIAMALIFGG